MCDDDSVIMAAMRANGFDVSTVEEAVNAFINLHRDYMSIENAAAQANDVINRAYDRIKSRETQSQVCTEFKLNKTAK